MASKTGFKKLTPQEYSSAKALLSMDGVTRSMVVRITGRSPATIYNIANSTSLDDYRARVLETANKYRDAAASSATSAQEGAPEVQANSTAANESSGAVGSVDRSDETLTRIAVALERLADAWENSPTKKTGIFG